MIGKWLRREGVWLDKNEVAVADAVFSAMTKYHGYLLTNEEREFIAKFHKRSEGIKNG